MNNEKISEEVRKLVLENVATALVNTVSKLAILVEEQKKLHNFIAGIPLCMIAEELGNAGLKILEELKDESEKSLTNPN